MKWILFVMCIALVSGCGTNDASTPDGSDGRASQEEDPTNRIVGSWEGIKLGVVFTFTDDGIVKMTHPDKPELVHESKYVFTSDDRMVVGESGRIKNDDLPAPPTGRVDNYKVEFYKDSVTLTEVDSRGKEKSFTFTGRRIK